MPGHYRGCYHYDISWRGWMMKAHALHNSRCTCLIGNKSARKASGRVISLNRAFRQDPSRTLTLRAKFVREMNVRFRVIKTAIRRAVVDLDVFGLQDPEITANVLTADEALARIQARQFAFPRTADKVDGFMQWLEDTQKRTVLAGMDQVPLMEVIRRPGRRPGKEAWSDIYVHSAYSKGILRGRQELKNAGVAVPKMEFDDTDYLRHSFNQPIHAERLGVAYTRTYNELKGVTQAMDQQISRVLAEGLGSGLNPRVIARNMMDRVDKIGLPRAKMIAHTETMRAHHKANMGEYKQAQIEGIGVMAEWRTALDDKVCEECAPLERKRFTMEEAEDLLPAHVFCRCVAVPWIPEMDMELPSKVEEPEPGLTYDGTRQEWEEARTKAQEALPGSEWAELQDKERKAYYRHVSTFSPELYRAERDKKLSSMISIEGQKIGSKTPASTMGKFRKGTDWIPFDMLDTLERRGARVDVTKSSIRAEYSPSHLKVKLDTRDSPSIIAHEFSHAIDDLVLGRNLQGTSQYKGTGFLWENTPFSSDEDRIKLKREFRSLHSGQTGKYANGDGEYWKDNWLDNYEGRIYKRWGDGTEWWAMNCQRFSDHQNQLTKYDETLSKFAAESERARSRGNVDYADAADNKAQRLRDEGRESWALRLSQWGKAQERYPELSSFIESKFGRQFAREDLGL